MSKAVVPLAPYPATLTLTDSRRTFQKLSGTSSKGCDGMTAVVDGGYVIGWFDGNTATLVHEATHVSLFLMEHCVIDPCATDGEPMAYLMGHIVQEALQRLG